VDVFYAISARFLLRSHDDHMTTIRIRVVITALCIFKRF